MELLSDKKASNPDKFLELTGLLKKWLEGVNLGGVKA
jgi:hypothetical protein